jgi:hypothetical protein
MAQERITITIDKDLLKKVDHTINKSTIRNRSHAIEELLTEALGNIGISSAVVFLGGENLEKSYKFKIPVIIQLIEIGIDEIHLVFGEYGADFIKYFNFENIDIYYHQTEFGSGGGLAEIIDDLPNDFYIVDIEKNIPANWDKIIKYYQQYCPTLCGEFDSNGFGCFVANNKIAKYLTPDFALFNSDVVSKVNEADELIAIRQ